MLLCFFADGAVSICRIVTALSATLPVAALGIPIIFRKEVPDAFRSESDDLVVANPRQGRPG